VHNFSADFWTFRNFDRNFAKIVAPPSNENENYIVHLKEPSILKKALKTASKSTSKPSHNTCLNQSINQSINQSTLFCKAP